MSFHNKVVWSEGMFLNPQHFQQQERYLEALIDQRMAATIAYGWGITDFRLDQQMLGLGKIAVEQAQGILPDGTVFNIPDIDAPPAVIDVPRNVQNTVVYLGLPVKRQGAVDVLSDDSAQSLARFTRKSQDTRDVVDESGEQASIDVGQLNLRLLLDSDDRSGYVCIGLVRIRETGEDSAIELDDSYIATCLDSLNSPNLKAYLVEAISLLHSRGESIAGRLADPNRGGTAEVADYLLLQLINRTLPAFKHMLQRQGLHPVELYLGLIQLVGELSTFMTADKKAPEFPVYTHDDLQTCFAQVIGGLRKCFSTVQEQTAIALQLVEKKFGIRVAEINDRSLIGTATFVLAAHADLTEEHIRTHVPAQLKVGPVERIRQLVNAAMPGIALAPIPVAPRQIPFHTGFSYFQLDPRSEFWKELKQSGGIAIHVGGDFPGLTLEFWAIRQ